MWLQVLLISLAAFTAWEWLLAFVPFAIPAGLQAPVVVAVAYGVSRLAQPWLGALAAAGVVALLHSVVRGGVVEPPSLNLRLPRRQRTPSPAVGNRVPDLP